MEYVRLVKDEKYPCYKKDCLSEDDYEFIDGLEHSMKLIEDWRNKQMYDEKSFIEQARKEFVDDAVEELKEHIHCTICQYIVEMIDNYEDDDPVDVINTTCPTTL